MRNFVQPGDVVTLVAPQGGVLSGAPVLVGSIFGVAAYDAIEAAEVEVAVVGVFDLPKAQGGLSQGDPVFFAAATGLVGDTGPGTVLVGVAVEGAGADAPTARVRLNGTAVVGAAA
jgi:predicted RecA/RadA family phage recombinase